MPILLIVKPFANGLIKQNVQELDTTVKLLDKWVREKNSTKKKKSRRLVAELKLILYLCICLLKSKQT